MLGLLKINLHDVLYIQCRCVKQCVLGVPLTAWYDVFHLKISFTFILALMPLPSFALGLGQKHTLRRASDEGREDGLGHISIYWQHGDWSCAGQMRDFYFHQTHIQSNSPLPTLSLVIPWNKLRHYVLIHKIDWPRTKQGSSFYTSVVMKWFQTICVVTRSISNQSSSGLISCPIIMLHACSKYFIWKPAPN